MREFSRSNRHYMRKFPSEWPRSAVVQQAVGQLPWGHVLLLIDRRDDQTSATGRRPRHSNAAGPNMPKSVSHVGSFLKQVSAAARWRNPVKCSPWRS
ncbi:DUF1016 N-terminal domain-containing protein [Rhodococcus sp. T7]|uniref:DUF1016 N-terminal domain-containing protein n=1 Tax=Rhodococcus sp. T7 TaxID=627444 RepID=UPI001F170B3D